MLAALLAKLGSEPFETSVLVHGPNQQVALKMRIIAADQVGIVASVKGLMGGWSEPIAYPWSAIVKVSL